MAARADNGEQDKECNRERVGERNEDPNKVYGKVMVANSIRLQSNLTFPGFLLLPFSVHNSLLTSSGIHFLELCVLAQHKHFCNSGLYNKYFPSSVGLYKA